MCLFLDPNIRRTYGYSAEGDVLNNLKSMKQVINLVLLRYLYLTGFFGSKFHKLLNQIKPI